MMSFIIIIEVVSIVLNIFNSVIKSFMHNGRKS